MDVLEFLRAYWAIITAIVGAIVLAVRQESKVNELVAKDHEQEVRINKLATKMEESHNSFEMKIERTNENINEMKQHLAEIKVILEFLRDNYKV